MRFRGFTTRWWLIVVAIVAVVIGVRVELTHRTERFSKRNMALSLEANRYFFKAERQFRHSLDGDFGEQFRIAHWYAAQAKRYRELGDRPWIPWEPDPEHVTCDCQNCTSWTVRLKDGVHQVIPRSEPHAPVQIE
jgi:hypothetical protein